MAAVAASATGADSTSARPRTSPSSKRRSRSGPWRARGARSCCRWAPTATPTRPCRTSRPTIACCVRRARADHRRRRSPQPGPDRQRVLVPPDVEATHAARRRPGRDGGEARPGDRAGPQAVERRRSPTSATTRSSPSATASSRSRPAGLPWRGPAYVNVVVSASHRRRSPVTCCWSARTRPRPSSSRTWPGSGWCASGPRPPGPRRPIENACLCGEIAITKQHTVVLAHRAARAREGRAAAGQGASGHRRDRPARAGSDLHPDVHRRPARTRWSRAAPADELRDLEGPALQVHRASTASRPTARRPRASTASPRSSRRRPATST